MRRRAGGAYLGELDRRPPHLPLATLRRPACSHWAITIMCRGALGNPRRVFNPPQDQPAARSGHPYPLDWWSEGNGRADRPRLLRYDNSLPLPLVLRAVTAFSDDGEHVVDPFLGGGTTAVACWRAGRRFTGGDLNPHALRFSAARLLAEHARPDDRQPALPGPAGQPGPTRLATAVQAALQLELFGEA